MASYSNDLTTLQIPTSATKADLSYTSVTIKEYPGIGISTIPNVSLSGSTVPTTVVVNKTTMAVLLPGITTVESTTVGTQLPTVNKVQSSIPTKVVETTLPVEQVTVVEPVGLADVLSRVSSEGMTNLADQIPVLPAADSAHSHSAYDVYETEKRIWFTPDERLELRGTYAELMRFEGLLGDLVPKVSRTIVFCTPDIPDVKNLVEIRFPWNGVIKELDCNYSRYDNFGYQFGPETTILNVQHRVDGTWVDLLADPIILSEDNNRVVLGADIVVSKDDLFRLRFISISNYIKNIVVQVVIDA